MPQRRIPRPSNSETDLRSLKAYVPVDTWSEVMDRAEKAGLSVSRYLSALIDRDQLDEHGRPVWAPHANAEAEPLPGMETAAA